jgi:hypothetical protein
LHAARSGKSDAGEGAGGPDSSVRTLILSFRVNNKSGGATRDIQGIGRKR